MAIEIVRPDADGSETGWNLKSGESGAKCLQVDETTKDDDTTYLRTSGGFGGTVRQLFTGTDGISGSPPITGLTLKYYQKRSASNAPTSRAVVKLSGSYSYGSEVTVDVGAYTTLNSATMSKPGGGSWTLSDLRSAEFGFERVNAGALKTETRVTQFWYEIEYTAGGHSAPTDLEADHETNPSNASELPDFTAIFNAFGGSGTATEVEVQLNDADDFSSPLWDSGWVSIDDTDDSERSSPVIYDGSSVLQTGVRYYWRIKFRDASLVESTWSDSATIDGFRRVWPAAFDGYRSRQKILWDTPHPEIPAGYTQRFTIKTGNRKIVASNGFFNEAIQASGGFQVVYHQGRTHYVYLANFGDNSGAANSEIWIVTKDHQTGLWGVPVFIAATGTAFDTHYFPGIEVDGDGYLHVAIGSHYGPMYYVRSKYPNVSGSLPDDPDPDSEDLWIRPDTGAAGKMTLPSSTAGTYPILIWVADKGRLYYVYRYGSFAAAYRYYLHFTDDNGETWSGPYVFLYDQQVWDGNNQHYRLYLYGLRYDPKLKRMIISWSHNHEIGGTGDTERGIWCAYSNLDETVVSSQTTMGFNVWRWANGDQAGLTVNNPIGWDPSRAIALSYVTDPTSTYGSDRLTKIFSETAVLDAAGEPIIFWEEKDYRGSPTGETNLVCAKWSSPLGSSGSWEISYITDQVNLPLRVRRSSIGVMTDKDGLIRALMPVNAKTYLGLIPASDYESTSATSSEATIYEALDDGLTICDGDSTYVDLAVGGKFACGHAGLSSQPRRLDQATILGVDVEIVAKSLGSYSGGEFYLDDGSTEDGQAFPTVIASGVGWDYMTIRWETNPFTAAAWDQGDIDGLKFGVRSVSNAGLRVSKINLRIYYTLAATERLAASELWLLTSLDGGSTWTASEESRNSAIGVPILNHKHQLTNEAVEIVWISGYDLFYFTDRPFGLMQTSGIDFRLAYGGTEIARILDYPNLDESSVIFKVQETIEPDAIAGPKDYEIFSDNPNEGGQPSADPTDVESDYENWETYNEGDTLPLGDWTAEAGSGSIYSSPPSHANKVFAGEKALNVPSLYNAKTLNSTISLDSHRVEAAVWQETGGGDNKPRLEIEDGSGNKFAVGYNNATDKAGYLVDSTWIDVDEVRASQQHYIRLALQIVNGKLTAWVEDQLILLELETGLTTATKLRLCSPANCYWDYIRVSRAVAEAEVNSYAGTAANNRTINTSSGTDSDDLEVPYDAYSETQSDNVRKLYLTVEGLADSGTGTATLTLRICTGATWDSSKKVRQRTFDIALSGSLSEASTSYVLDPGQYTFKVDFHSDTGGMIYNYLRLKSWTETIGDPVEPTVTLQGEELKGYRFDAVVKGPGEFQYNFDALVDKYRLRQRLAAPLAWSGYLSAAAALALAHKGYLSAGGQAPLAWAGYLTTGAALALGSLELVELKSGLAIGSRGGLASPAALAIDWTELQQISSRIPLAWGGYLSAGARIPLAADLTSRIGGRIPLGSRTRLDLPGSLPASWRSRIDIPSSAWLAWSGYLTTQARLVAASGAIVNASGEIPLENAATLQEAFRAPIEGLAAVVVQDRLSIAFLAVSEALAGRLEVEINQKTTAAGSFPIGIGSRLVAAAALPVSYRTTFRALGALQIAFKALVLELAGLFPVESLTRADAEGGLPAAWRQKTAYRLRTPLAFGGGILVSAGGYLPIEFRQGIRIAGELVLESRLVHQVGILTPVDIGSRILSAAAIRFENKKEIELPASLAIDCGELATISAASPVEFGLKIPGIAGGFELELLAGTLAAAALPVEWRGAGILSVAGGFPVEFRAALSAQAAHRLEILQTLRSSGRFEISNRVTVSVAGKLPLAWGISITIVSSAAALLIEWTARIDARLDLEIESRSTIDAAVQARLEFLQTSEVVTARIPLEATLRAISSGRIPLAWAGIAFAAVILQEIALGRPGLIDIELAELGLDGVALGGPKIDDPELAVGEMEKINLADPELDNEELKGGATNEN